MKDRFFWKEITAVTSILFLVCSVVAYSFYVSGHMLFCPYLYKYFYIYSDAFGYTNLSACGDAAASFSKNLGVAFLIISAGAASLIVLTEERFRRLFKRFITMFIPVGIIIFIIGVLSSSCLMWSCHDGVTPALQFDFLLVLLVVFTLAWSILLPSTHQRLGVVFLLLIPLALFFSLHVLNGIELRPIDSTINAIESNNVDECPTVTKDLGQSCVQQVAIGLRNKGMCERLDGQFLVFCVNAVEEQIALDTRDISLCSNISETDWKDNCLERLREQLKK